MKNAICGGLTRKSQKQLAFVLAICLVCMVPVTTYAQILKISMKRTNVSIQNVIRELEQKVGILSFTMTIR
ncbi:hypothetical protein [Bacteroides fragilis]|uniref:hypothetical protein n=1 Tax=Bacteroides fragilis TaxID=817 RepID=UPI0020308723|nr:hypothetical protein [Bacteroides fragilis]